MEDKQCFMKQLWGVYGIDNARVVKVVIGHLIIANYRVFKKYQMGKCLIMMKNKQCSTEYLYFTVIDTEAINKQIYSNIKATIAYLEKFIGRKQQKLKIVICSLVKKCYWELGGEDLQELLKNDDIRNMVSINGGVIALCQKNTHQQYEHDIKIFDFKKIKKIINVYIDTFGRKYKDNYEYNEIVKEVGQEDLQRILNTVALIIYEESYGKNYNHLESTYWTTFNKKASEILADRKDILLSGGGKFVLLDIVFFIDFENYISQQYQKQAKLILDQAANQYSQSQLKIINISNIINNQLLTYKYAIHDINSPQII